MATRNQSLKYFAILFLYSLLALHFSIISVCALNIGIQPTESALYVTQQCSTKCESQFCSVPPFLRYGKYCGALYGGCHEEEPCDGLDSCCKIHDDCIGAKNNDYLNVECNQELLNCMKRVKNSKRRTFPGNKCNVNEVIDALSVVIEAAVLAGKIAHKP